MIVSYDVSRVYLPFIDKPFPDIEDFLVSTFPAISRECWNTRINHGLVLTDSGHPVVKNTPYIPGSFLYYLKRPIGNPVSRFRKRSCIMTPIFWLPANPISCLSYHPENTLMNAFWSD